MARRKSIVSMFGDLSNDPPPPPTDAAKAPVAPRSKRVGAGVIGTAQRSMTELREERDRLHRALAEGEGVVTLDPSLIDPSPVVDRLPDDGEASFEAFKASVEASGQKVPVTVRAHPDAPDRYQTVYGHRRIRALRELGRSVRALVVDWSDRDLLVAQGIENADRQDLSWIERALFAARMTDRGLKPRDVKAALGVDDARLSKFRAVTNALPSDLIEGIGRAPKIGRPRWLELAELAKAGGSLGAARDALADGRTAALPSDDRFGAVLAAMKTGPKPARARKAADERRMGSVGTVRFGRSDVRIVLDRAHADDFKRFLARELDDLVRRYEAERSKERPPE